MMRAALNLALVLITFGLSGCSKADDAAKASATPASTPPVNTPVPSEPPPPPTADAASWTPAALDELLAPIALYPDPLIAQVLAASTNAQEVLDAGNWLLDHQDLKGDDLTKAAADAGFTPSVQALVHFPTVVDMMCRELDWTKQIGDAFAADQGAVLASVQRLRKQAADAGNLKTSPEMTVTTTEQNGQPVIVVQPPTPQVIYVPQYNPQTVYTPAPATTTTTTGISTETAVVGGLLAFGAGMLIGNAIADDHDDHWGYPAWGYGGVYYGGRPYPPYPPYRPAYPGYRPTPYYRPPANYANRYNSNNRYGNTNINIDNSNNNYFNRFDKNQNRLSSYNPRSPIASTSASARDSYRGQTTYNGANRPRATTNDAMPGGDARIGKPAAGEYKGARTGQPTAGEYKGARTGQASATPRQTAQREAAKPAQRPGAGADRGYPKTTGSRADATAATQNRGGSLSGAGRNQGAADRAASERGRSSMKAAPRPSSSAARAGGGARASGGGRSRN